jgi:hypothetical protein
MALVFTTTEKINLDGGIKALIYGGSGMGKTVLAATAPRPLLISAESGTLSLSRANLEKLFGVNNPSITYVLPTIVITSLQDLTDTYDWCLRSREAQYFDTIILDSLSEIGEAVLNNAKRQVKDPRQAYGELIEKMESVIRLFRDLPNKNVYMAAKMEPTKDEMTGVVKYGPSMPGAKLGPKLPYFFDFVFRLGVNKTPTGESYRFLQTQPDIQHDAKDRSGMLDPLEPAHLGHIFAKVRGPMQQQQIAAPAQAAQLTQQPVR